MTLTELILQLIELAREHEAKLFTGQTDVANPEVHVVVEVNPHHIDVNGDVIEPVISMGWSPDEQIPAVWLRCD